MGIYGQLSNSMHDLEECQFYITDLCGVSCRGCITYNNWLWGHHLDLDPDTDAKMRQWAEHVNFDLISVLGGEPLLHPNLDRWLSVIQELWPRAELWITTNGERARDLRVELAQWIDQGWGLEISAHRPELDRELFDLLPQWFGGQWQPYDDKDPWCQRRLVREGRVIVELNRADQFYTQPWRMANGEITWDRVRDPRPQWQHCPARTCHYMVQGRLYACPQQAILPRLSQRARIDSQYLDLAQRDWGLEPRDYHRVGELVEPRDQCGLCAWAEPQQHTLDKIRGTKVIPLVPLSRTDQ